MEMKGEDSIGQDKTSKPNSKRFVEDEVGDGIFKASQVVHMMLLVDLLLMNLMAISKPDLEVREDQGIKRKGVLKMAMLVKDTTVTR